MPAAATVSYRLLVHTALLRRCRYGERIWDRVWQAACDRWVGPVTVRMHGRTMKVNFGYAYPVFATQYPTYNQPIVDAVLQAARQLGRPANVIDVGAAVGDTIVLLLDRARHKVGRVLAIDGDDEFVGYLRHNLGDVENVEIVHRLLSADVGSAPSLVRTHRGTASSLGETKVDAIPLDDVLAGSSLSSLGVDVLKTDTDGYDGMVLQGSRQLLSRHQPIAVFEWHPLLSVRTGNDPMGALHVLRDAGYDRFSWFSKRGEPEASPTEDEMRRRVSASLDRPELDLHWDVIAHVGGGRLTFSQTTVP